MSGSLQIRYLHQDRGRPACLTACLFATPWNSFHAIWSCQHNEFLIMTTTAYPPVTPSRPFSPCLTWERERSLWISLTSGTTPASATLVCVSTLKNQYPGEHLIQIREERWQSDLLRRNWTSLAVLICSISPPPPNKKPQKPRDFCSMAEVNNHL